MLFIWVLRHTFPLFLCKALQADLMMLGGRGQVHINNWIVLEQVEGTRQWDAFAEITCDRISKGSCGVITWPRTEHMAIKSKSQSWLMALRCLHVCLLLFYASTTCSEWTFFNVMLLFYLSSMLQLHCWSHFVGSPTKNGGGDTQSALGVL